MRRKTDRSQYGAPANDRDDVAAEPLAVGSTTRGRLEYLATMIPGLRYLASGVPQSSLASILDSAQTEIQVQMDRYRK